MRLGLIISLSGTIIIARYLYQEWTIDHWMPDLERICFAQREEYESNDPNANRSAMVAMKMPMDGQPITEMEGVEAATSVWLRSLFSVKLGGEKTFTVCTISADSDFVKVFPLKAVEGTLDLRVTGNSIISETLAKKMFPGQSAVGQTFMADNSLHTVTGIFREPATKSTLHYEMVTNADNEVCVKGIVEVDETSTEGYGIEVTKGAMSTTFPNIRNTREPQAMYNAKTGDLWLTSSAMEGTGVRVEWLYQIRFGENELAYVKTLVNPYDVQQQLLQRLGYTIEGENISLYDGDKLLATVKNTVGEMGGFDSEQPLWIGEQLYYDVSGDEPKVVFTPGVKYTTGLVLTYDDMPELSAPVTVDENGMITIHEINCNE